MFSSKDTLSLVDGNTFVKLGGIQIVPDHGASIKLDRGNIIHAECGGINGDLLAQMAA